MTDLRERIIQWQRGWGVARGLAPAEHLGAALRVHCRQPAREVEYFALEAGPALTGLAQRVAAEDAVTWLTVPTTDPDRDAAILQDAGLVLLRRSELMMTTDLRRHPQHAPAAAYRLESHLDSAVVTVTVRDAAGALGARGTMGLTGDIGVADKIETLPEHRRRGLASALMSALARAAAAEGAEGGLLIASEEGQHLYASLGWRPVAQVLIVTTPENADLA